MRGRAKRSALCTCLARRRQEELPERREASKARISLSLNDNLVATVSWPVNCKDDRGCVCGGCYEQWDRVGCLDI